MFTASPESSGEVRIFSQISETGTAAPTSLPANSARQSSAFIVIQNSVISANESFRAMSLRRDVQSLAGLHAARLNGWVGGLHFRQRDAELSRDFGHRFAGTHRITSNFRRRG